MSKPRIAANSCDGGFNTAPKKLDECRSGNEYDSMLSHIGDEDSGSDCAKSSSKSKMIYSHKKKSKNPKILRHGNVICINQGPFRMELAAPHDLLAEQKQQEKNYDEWLNMPAGSGMRQSSQSFVATVKLKHIQIENLASNSHTHRGHWRVHLRDSIRGGKKVCMQW